MKTVSLDDVREAQLRRAGRIGRAGMWIVTVMLLVVLGRVTQLQLAPGERLVAHLGDRMSQQTAEGRRGDIVDRRGRVLSATRLGQRLFVDPHTLEAPYGYAIHEIAHLTGMDPSDVGDRIVERVARNEHRRAEGRSPIRYVSVGGVLSDEQVVAAQALRIRGVHIESVPVREYIGPRELSSIVGKVGYDHTGLLGAERTFNGSMSAERGRLEYVRDARGRAMWVEAEGYEPARSGGNVYLSIDAVLQRIAQEELERGVRDADAAGGRLVIADPLTGEILAMVDYVRDLPGLVEYTPEAYQRAQASGIMPRFRTIHTDDRRSIHPALGRNRCVEDVYEPGSTIKPFVWASVTERGRLSPSDVLDTHHGVWRTDFGRTLRDVTPMDRLTWSDVLVYSSNIGMAQGALRLNGREMRDDLRRFGFGVRTRIGLPGESPGIMTNPRNWSHWTNSSVAQGYEIAVTPVQMVRAFSVFCREGEMAGTLPKLRLTAVDPDVDGSELLVRVLPEREVMQTREAMRRVAQNMEDRARRAYPDEEPIRCGMFGKSGTAEIVRPDGRGYFKGQHNSSFLIGAPFDDPRLVVLVVIDDPGPELVRSRRHYGSTVAGPVVRRVVRRSLEYMGLRADVDPAEPLAGG